MNILKKKNIIIFLFIILLFTGCTADVDTSSYYDVNSIKSTQVEESIQYNQPITDKLIDVSSLQEKKVAPVNDDTELSNDNYYINSQGNKVHSPAYADTVPTGATAKCRDGTFSFSQSRRGTCSHHGGVAQWL